jgi:hypothetical protein
MPGRPKKEFHEYLIERINPASAVKHSDYQDSPATAFLKYTIEAKNAINLCISNLKHNKDGSYNKATIDSLQHLIVAILPAIMGHFETYQRYLFAGMFEHSIYLKNFSIEEMLSKLIKASEGNVNIDLERLSAYRGIAVASVGTLLADSLKNWHSPKIVNKYFLCFGTKKDLFLAKECNDLSVLWQLRHSIVHTGGTLTISDAQKIPELSNFIDRDITFGDRFILEVSRKMHMLIKDSTTRVGDAYKSRLIAEIPVCENVKIEKLFRVDSSMPVWLK